MRVTHMIEVPQIAGVRMKCGDVYPVGGMTNAGIRKLGEEITKAMLETAKKQRAEMRKKGKK